MTPASQRRQKRPHVHFIGVCGKGMGAIASELARNGWNITGSDQDVYPPMSDYLETARVPVACPYHPANIPESAELVVVGKRVPSENAELRHALKSGTPHLSFPAFLHDYFLNQSRNAVVAGGVGKTTTTAMLAWILVSNGVDPDYLIGGKTRNLEHPARLMEAGISVLEGDEYASCFDDDQPKFSHYNAEVAIITNILEDHPDLYEDIASLVNVFRTLVEKLPAQGCLICADDDPQVSGLLSSAPCETITTGFGPEATQPITDLNLGHDRSEFKIDGAQFSLPHFGRMNVMNASMASLAARHFDVSLEESARALSDFVGLENRQATESVGDCLIVRDKATHPFALLRLFEATRQQFPGRRIVSFIQPRATGGREWVYQKELPEALSQADTVIIAPPYEHRPERDPRWKGGPFSAAQLEKELHDRNVETQLIPNYSEIPNVVSSTVESGDIIVLTLPEQAIEIARDVREAVENR